MVILIRVTVQLAIKKTLLFKLTVFSMSVMNLVKPAQLQILIPVFLAMKITFKQLTLQEPLFKTVLTSDHSLVIIATANQAMLKLLAPVNRAFHLAQPALTATLPTVILV
jgi:hypothetical protein